MHSSTISSSPILNTISHQSSLRSLSEENLDDLAWRVHNTFHKLVSELGTPVYNIQGRPQFGIKVHEKRGNLKKLIGILDSEEFYIPYDTGSPALMDYIIPVQRWQIARIDNDAVVVRLYARDCIRFVQRKIKGIPDWEAADTQWKELIKKMEKYNPAPEERKAFVKLFADEICKVNKEQRDSASIRREVQNVVSWKIENHYDIFVNFIKNSKCSRFEIISSKERSTQLRFVFSDFQLKEHFITLLNRLGINLEQSCHNDCKSITLSVDEFNNASVYLHGGPKSYESIELQIHAAINKLRANQIKLNDEQERNFGLSKEPKPETSEENFTITRRSRSIRMLELPPDCICCGYETSVSMISGITLMYLCFENEESSNKFVDFLHSKNIELEDWQILKDNRIQITHPQLDKMIELNLASSHASSEDFLVGTQESSKDSLGKEEEKMFVKASEKFQYIENYLCENIEVGESKHGNLHFVFYFSSKTRPTEFRAYLIEKGIKLEKDQRTENKIQLTESQFGKLIGLDVELNCFARAAMMEQAKLLYSIQRDTNECLKRAVRGLIKDSGCVRFIVYNNHSKGSVFSFVFSDSSKADKFKEMILKKIGKEIPKHESGRKVSLKKKQFYPLIGLPHTQTPHFDESFIELLKNCRV